MTIKNFRHPCPLCKALERLPPDRILNQQGLCEATAQGYTCTRFKHHRGNHHAAGIDRCVASWSGK